MLLSLTDDSYWRKVISKLSVFLFFFPKSWAQILNQETFICMPRNLYKVPMWYLWHKSSLNRILRQLWTEVHFCAMSPPYNKCNQVSSPEATTLGKYRSKSIGIESCFGLPFHWMKQECNLTCIHKIPGGKRTVGKKYICMLLYYNLVARIYFTVQISYCLFSV